MPYRVRSPDGELDFPDMADIAQAYAAGLVDPDDEVLEAGTTTWRKARSLPFLAGTKASGRTKLNGYYKDVLIALGLSLLSFYLAFFREGRLMKGLGFLMAFLAAFSMRRLMWHAWGHGKRSY